MGKKEKKGWQKKLGLGLHTTDAPTLYILGYSLSVKLQKYFSHITRIVSKTKHFKLTVSGFTPVFVVTFLWNVLQIQ